MKHLLLAMTLGAAAFATDASAQSAKPTVVLVHGAFADSSSWDGVTAKLQADGYRVIGVANPLRGVKSDAVVIDNDAGPTVTANGDTAAAAPVDSVR